MIAVVSIMVELGVANDKIYKQCSNDRIKKTHDDDRDDDDDDDNNNNGYA